jgi:hypothetical protein
MMTKPDVTLAGEVRDSLWQELVAAVACDWPGHPDPLNDAAVLRRIEQLAGQVRGQSPFIHRQVIDDAPGVIFRAFGKFQRGRRFNPWARRVLYNHGISLHRRQRRMRLDSDSLNTVASPLAAPPEDQLAGLLRDFRRLCDRVCFSLGTAERPQLAVVFALETRLRLLAGLVCLGPDFLDSHLPLREWERNLRARPDWPTLGELWDVLAHSAQPGLNNIDAIRHACRRLAPQLPVEGLHRVWNTWLTRAKECVARHLQSHVQARLFFHLFPHHRLPEAQAGLVSSEGWWHQAI